MASTVNRRTKLTPGSYLLIRPEDTQVSILGCTYAKVEKVVGRWAIARSTTPVAVSIKIGTSIAATRLVSQAEATRHQTGLWLRKPVYFVDGQGAYQYGQVVQYRGTRVQVECDEGAVIGCAASALNETDPIIVLLLRGADITSASVDGSEIEDLHSKLLSKLLGNPNDPSALTSRCVEEILADVPNMQDPPAEDSLCTWIDESDGQRKSFSLRHAINYAYFIDGVGDDDADGMELGLSFCCPPVADLPGPVVAPATEPRSAPRAAQRRRAVRSALSTTTSDSFYASDFGDDDDGVADDTPMVSRTVNDQATQGRVERLLAAQPDLLAHYRHLQNNGGPGRLSDSHQLPSAPRPSKHAFSPTAHQVRVHRVISAHHSNGTSPATFVDALISHRAVQFLPHPGIFTRLFDFQFGSRGLSIMHLRPINKVARMDWIMAGSVNMQNFSASVELPKAASPSSEADILSCIACLRTYAAAFGSVESVGLIDSMFGFAQELTTWQVWEVEDLPYLVYFLNGVLEQYRTSAEADSISLGSQRLLVVDQLQMGNGELHQILQVVNARRITRMSNAKGGNSNRHDGGARGVDKERLEQRRGGQANDGRRGQPLPAHLVRELPRQGKLSLCLQYLSSVGCPDIPKQPGLCKFPRRAHFVPASLSAGLKEYIHENFGGLQARHNNL